MRPKVLALVGPTAAGKSALAVRLAPKINAEIVSVDSGAIYRGMDIGTEKPSHEELAAVPHHMIDVIDPSESVSVSQFQGMARAAVEDIIQRRKLPLLVGGSGLYFRAVVDPLEFPPSDPELRSRIDGSDEDLYERLMVLDPAAATRIDRANTRRTVRALEVIELTGRLFSSFRTAWDVYESIYDLTAAGLTWPREELDHRINARVEDEFARGLVQETKDLLAQNLRESITSVQALGYAQVLEHFDGKITLDEAKDRIKNRTRRFARRQLTWFRADPRIRWFESDPEGATSYLTGAI